MNDGTLGQSVGDGDIFIVSRASHQDCPCIVTLALGFLQPSYQRIPCSPCLPGLLSFQPAVNAVSSQKSLDRNSLSLLIPNIPTYTLTNPLFLPSPMEEGPSSFQTRLLTFTSDFISGIINYPFCLTRTQPLHLKWILPTSFQTHIHLPFKQITSKAFIWLPLSVEGQISQMNCLHFLITYSH